MKRHKIELDPVSNRRLICLLALTAGICFQVFVEISCLDAPQLADLTAPPPPLSFSRFNSSFPGQPAAPRVASASITAHLSAISYNAIFDKYDGWIPAGLSSSSFLFRSFVISFSIWLPGFLNCRLGFGWNRSQSRSASPANNTKCSSQQSGFSNYYKKYLGQPVLLSKARASEPFPIMDAVAVTIITGSSQSTTTSEETQSPSA